MKDPSSSLTATYVPLAGMVATSLADGEDEFLGQRRGLDADVMQLASPWVLPILYPWANRLSACSKYGINGAVVTLTAGHRWRAHPTSMACPIHGVLAAYPGWLVTAQDGQRR